MNSNTSKVTVKKENQLNSIIVDPIPSATNSSRLILSGTLIGFDGVEVYLNDEKVKEIEGVTESFSEELEGLSPGTNSIYFIAKNIQTKQTKKSNQYTVLLKTEKPKLDISYPKEGDTINKQEIIILGETEIETFIQINMQPVVVDASGKFQHTIKLSEGENKIQISATDIAENTESKIITVSYVKDD